MHKPEIRPLVVSTLLVDPAIQRPLDKRRVGKIAAELNLDALGVLTVSQRGNGDHILIDGQHRAEALKEAGQSTHKAVCRIFAGLSLAEEAEMFRLLNNTAKPLYVDVFRVRVIEGDPNAVDIARTLKRSGWKISSSTGTAAFAAIAAFERIYNMDPVAAERTIAVITRAWGHDPIGADGRIVEGIGLVLARHGDAVATDDLIERLSKFPAGPGALLGKARGLKELIGSTVPRAVAEVVVEEYNRRRRTKALPAWRSS